MAEKTIVPSSDREAGGAEQLFSLSYVSSCVLAPGSEQRSGFAAILDESRRNNQRWRITGALLFYDEMFLQVLEGSRQSVEALFATIRRDRRHTRIHHLGTDPIVARRFARWSMAFVNPGHVGAAFVGVSLARLRDHEMVSAEPVLDAMLERLKAEERDSD